MKWSGWIVFSLTALAVTAGSAAEPRTASPRLLPTQVVPARFASARQEAPPAAPITPQAPVHYRLATWDIWSGTHTGYVYSPGACDYTPPCVDHLWDGYEQRPHRCNPISMHCGGMHGCGHCGGHGGCNSCGAEAACGCDGHMSRLKRAHGWHFGGKVHSCTSCAAPTCAAPSCAAPSCGYAPSCGCDAIGGKGYEVAPLPVDGPPQPMPEAAGEAPTVDDFGSEKAARGNRLRGFSGPERSMR